MAAAYLSLSSPSSFSRPLLRLAPSSSSSSSSSSASSFFCSPLSLRLPRIRTREGRMVRVATRSSMEAGVGVMGTKLGMMTYFEQEGGAAVPVTVVGFREGNVVTQVKTAATDGYDAVQIGYRRVRDTKLTRPELGHLRKAGAAPMRHLQEFRLQSVDGLEPGQALVLEDLFKEGDLVDVSGNSIGKGFQGSLCGIGKYGWPSWQPTLSSRIPCALLIFFSLCARSMSMDDHQGTNDKHGTRFL